MGWCPGLDLIEECPTDLTGRKPERETSAGCCGHHCRNDCGTWPTACGWDSRTKNSLRLTKIDHWFLEQLRDLVNFEQRLVEQAAKPSAGTRQRVTLGGQRARILR